MTQTTFEIAASGDDAYVTRSDANGTVYPPPGGTGIDIVTSNDYIQCEKSKWNYGSGLRFWVGVGLLRFDTSSIPDDATVTAATLRVNVSSAPSSKTLSFEWYAFDGSAAVGDWTTTVSATAGTLSTGAGGNLGFQNVTLTTPTNVSKTGYTGFRIHMNGNEPAENNSGYIVARDISEANAPELVVTYTEAVVVPLGSRRRRALIEQIRRKQRR